jgi:TolB-like protein/DNA-binding winged helix-turn-helix (wHTH) protein/Flp pilus assembly protein TadD
MRFGVFELDPRAGELRKNGAKVKLQEQPLQILALLLERPGEVVTREELHQALWPEGTFVDFEHGLNAGVNRLRDALGDTPENPRFVETIPRRGYRFIAPVEKLATEAKARRLPLAPAWMAALAVILAGLIYLGWHSLQPPAETPGKKIMLAVLPFENLSADAEQEYFSDGLTEEMIAQLGQLRPERLGVIARTSAMVYKDTAKPVDQIGRELGVDYIVEGSVRREDNRARITVQLIQVQDQTHMWSESYERELKGIFSVQTEVAELIARSLAVELLPAERAALADAPTGSAEAYEAYLKGRYYYSKSTPGFTAKALASFQEAIEKDPEYAMAHAGLADCYTLDAGLQLGLTPQEAYPRAREAAAKALELDNALSEAHAAMAQVRFDYDWDFRSALDELKLAVDLNPNNVLARNMYGHYSTWVGRHDEAIAQLRHARELDPFSLLTMRFLGHSLFFAGRYDQALAQTRSILELDAADPLAFYVAGRVHLERGEFEQAIAEIEKGRALLGSGPDSALAYAHAVAGNREEAMEILGELEALSAQQQITPYALAGIYAGLRESDKALEALERAYEEHSPFMIMLKVEPMFKPLRDHPRFQSLMRRMDFPA